MPWDRVLATFLEQGAVPAERIAALARGMAQLQEHASLGRPAMDVLVVATDGLRALSLEATLDVGGHRVVGLADSAAAALDQARVGRPALAIVQLDGHDHLNLISELRDGLCVPSLLVGTEEECTAAYRAGALGLVHEPCGSRLILRAVRVAGALREGRRPRGRLPQQIELFGSRPGRRSNRQGKAAA